MNVRINDQAMPKLVCEREREEKMNLIHLTDEEIRTLVEPYTFLGSPCLIHKDQRDAFEAAQKLARALASQPNGDLPLVSDLVPSDEKIDKEATDRYWQFDSAEKMKIFIEGADWAIDFVKTKQGNDRRGEYDS